MIKVPSFVFREFLKRQQNSQIRKAVLAGLAESAFGLKNAPS